MKRLLMAVLWVLFAVSLFAAVACSGAVPSSTSAVTVGSPAKLIFITQPGGGAAGEAFSIQPVVAIQDANGNTVTNAILPVKLTITDNYPGGPSILGASTVNAVNGIATFHSVSVDIAKSAYTLTATSGKLTSAVSQSFAITAGAPAKLAFTVQPSGGTAGKIFQTPPEVTVQDLYGNTVTEYQGTVNLDLIYGSAPTNAVLSGGTASVSGNVARFTEISINRTYPEFKLMATSDSLISATSQYFAIIPAEPAKLEFTTQPGAAKAGTTFETEINVAIVDQYSNVATSSRDTITVSITPGTGTSGAVLSGVTTKVAEDAMGGLASFDELSIDLPGTGYTLTASSDNFPSIITQPFDVTAP